MKKIDPKSLIIGMLSMLLLIVIVGASPIGATYENLFVKQISIVDDDGNVVGVLTDGFLRTYNSDGKVTGYFGTDQGGSGVVMTYNIDEKVSVYAGTGTQNAGMLITYNGNGKESGYFGTDNKETGMLRTKDRDGNITTELGSVDGDRNGYLNLYKVPEGSLTGRIYAGLFSAYNQSGDTVAVFGINSNKGGELKTWNKDDQISSYIGTVVDGSGLVQINSPAGDTSAIIYSGAGGAAMNIYNKDSKFIGFIGSDESANGEMYLANTNGVKTIYAETTKDENGLLHTYNKSKNETANIGTTEDGRGIMHTFGKAGNETANIGTTADGHGLLQTFAKSGNETGNFGTNLKENGQLQLFNSADQMTAFVGTSTEGNGQMRTWNTKGNMTSYVGTSSDGNGQLRTWNIYGKLTVFCGTSSNHNGQVQLYNLKGYERAYLGLDSVKLHGLIRLSDSDGDVEFTEP